MGRAVGFYRWAMVAACILSGIAVMFFASVDQLGTNGGVRGRGGGDIFLGLMALVGQPIARGLIASFFFLCAWLFARPARPKS